MRAPVESLVGVSMSLVGLLAVLFGAGQAYTVLAVAGVALLIAGVLVWPGLRYRRIAQRTRVERGT